MVAFMEKVMKWLLFLPFVGAATFTFMFFENISWLAPIIGFVVGGIVYFAFSAVLYLILPERIFCAITHAASTDGGDPHHQFERAFTQNELLK